MSNIIGSGDIQNWIKDHTRKVRTIEQNLGKLRLPRQVTSATRPNPASQQPGASYFETDTGKTIVVNGTSSGYVTPLGTPDTGQAPPSVTPVPVTLTTFGAGVAVRTGGYTNNAIRMTQVTHLEFMVTLSAAVAQYGQLAQLPDPRMYPPIDAFVHCAFEATGGTWVSGECYVTSDGWLRPLTWAPSSGTMIGGQGDFEHV